MAASPGRQTHPDPMSGSLREHLSQSERERGKNTTLLSTPMDSLQKIFSTEAQPFLIRPGGG